MTTAIVPRPEGIDNVVPFRRKEGKANFVMWNFSHAVFRGTDDLTTSEVAVLLCLADHANESGETRPSQATIAKETRLSERAVRRAIKRLRGTWFTCSWRPTTNAKQLVYHLVVPDTQSYTSIGHTVLQNRTHSPIEPDSQSYKVIQEELHEEKDIPYGSSSKDSDAKGDDLPSVASREKPSRKSKTSAKSARPSAKSKEAKPKKENPFGPQAKELVTLANRLLKERDRPGLSGRPWGVSERAASSALADNCPFEELGAAIEWAVEDDRRRADLQANGLRYVKRLWADWLERDSKPRYGNSQPAPTAKPQFDPNGPWADAN